MADTVPHDVLYRAAALTGLASKVAPADLTPEAYKKIAKAVCDMADAVAEEAAERARILEAQKNRRY